MILGFDLVILGFEVEVLKPPELERLRVLDDMFVKR